MSYYSEPVTLITMAPQAIETVPLSSIQHAYYPQQEQRYRQQQFIDSNLLQQEIGVDENGNAIEAEAESNRRETFDQRLHNGRRFVGQKMVVGGEPLLGAGFERSSGAIGATSGSLEAGFDHYYEAGGGFQQGLLRPHGDGLHQRVHQGTAQPSWHWASENNQHPSSSASATTAAATIADDDDSSRLEAATNHQAGVRI